MISYAKRIDEIVEIQRQRSEISVDSSAFTDELRDLLSIHQAQKYALRFILAGFILLSYIVLAVIYADSLKVDGHEEWSVLIGAAILSLLAAWLAGEWRAIKGQEEYKSMLIRNEILWLLQKRITGNKEERRGA